MLPVTLLTMLRAELERRQAANARYSLRSFARDLHVDHSSLSQILRGRRRLTGRSVRALGRRLRLAAPQIAELCAIENEAAVLAALDRPNVQADSRWVATMGDPARRGQRHAAASAQKTDRDDGGARPMAARPGGLVGDPVMQWQIVAKGSRGADAVLRLDVRLDDQDQ